MAAQPMKGQTAMNQQPTSASATAEEAVEHLQHSKSHAVQAAEELRAAAAQKAKELREAASVGATRIRETATQRAAQVRDYAEHGWDDARVKAKEWQQSGEAYVRDNPMKAVLTALGVGFVVGLLFRR